MNNSLADVSFFHSPRPTFYALCHVQISAWMLGKEVRVIAILTIIIEAGNSTKTNYSSFYVPYKTLSPSGLKCGSTNVVSEHF